MRGCQKRVIYLKNTGSEYFEEAYFVLKTTDSQKRSDTDIIREANRIIEENIGKRKRIDFKRYLPLVLTFLIGAATGVLIFA